MNVQAIPEEWSVEIRRRRTALLDNLLMAAFIGGAIPTVLVYFTVPGDPSPLERLITTSPFIAAWLAILVAWRWRAIDYRVRAMVPVLLALALSVIVFARGGLPGSGRVWLLLPPVLALVFIGPRAGVAMAAASVLTYAVISAAITQKWVVPQVVEDLTSAPPLIVEGSSFVLAMAILSVILWAFNQAWQAALLGMSDAHEQLQAQARELEEANRQLRQHTLQLQATAEVARAGSSLLEMDTLLKEVVRLIHEGFAPLDVHYVGLFLLDETEQHAVLRAATGDAGRQLVEMGHSLRVDETSSVGRCIIAKQAYITSDVGERALHLDRSLLALTRSEIVLPLYSRGRVLGALSVQSTREAAFSETDIATLQMMANQVALAIDNARLLSQTRAALDELQEVHRRYLARAWGEFLTTRPDVRIVHSRPGAEPVDEDLLRQARRRAMRSGQTVTIEHAAPDEGNGAGAVQSTLVIPLKLRGQVIGTMALQGTRRPRPWTAEEIDLAETIAEQVALTIENLRLLEEAQRRATRERLTSEISSRMRETLDLDTVLQTAVREIGERLGLQDVTIRLGGTDGAGEAQQEEVAL